MNEFTAKKLGEVLAFAVVGIETFEKGKIALVSVLGEDEVTKLISQSSKHRDVILKIAGVGNVLDIVNKKLEGTGMKLRAMRDLYVGDQWDNPTELLEWSGFFEGAAVVHWSLVKGAGERTNNQEIKNLAEEAVALHKEILDMAITQLHNVGMKKSV